MERGELHIPYQIFENSSELEPDEQALLTSAWEATQNSYAPFSHFHVGCAIQLVDGNLILGNNQENRAYPSGLCAERTALFHAGAMGKGSEIRKLAVRARGAKHHVGRPVMPCGACRQVMLEYEEMAEAHFVILMQGEGGKILRMEGVRQSLLPFPFDLEL